MENPYGAPPPQRFPTTRWSMVERAADDGHSRGRDALSELLMAYLPALRGHVMSRWRMHHADAEDILQAFVAEKVIRQRLIARADQRRGRFRSFLLTVLDNFVRERLRASASGLGRALQRPMPLEAVASDHAGATGANTFEVEWARAALGRAIASMRDACRQRPEVWAVFEARTLGPALQGRDPEPYPALVDRLGLASAMRAANTLVTAKRMFERHLRDELGAYARDEDEAEQELRDLIEILSRQRAD